MKKDVDLKTPMLRKVLIIKGRKVLIYTLNSEKDVIKIAVITGGKEIKVFLKDGFRIIKLTQTHCYKVDMNCASNMGETLNHVFLHINNRVGDERTIEKDVIQIYFPIKGNLEPKLQWLHIEEKA